MGRYLDLIRDPGTSERTEPAKYNISDISDISDQSHVEVESLERTKSGTLDWSLMSLMSHRKADDFSLETELSAERDSRDLGAWQRGLRRLDICRPPEGVPCDRWRTFVAAAARFLAGPFAERASALGWTALDLFGCDHSRPVARLEGAGLIWLLNGQKLIALTAETAVVRARTGARQTYRRSRKPTQVLAWELS
jgi:hypothetical protein